MGDVIWNVRGDGDVDFVGFLGDDITLPLYIFTHGLIRKGNQRYQVNEKPSHK
jgi:hypothetical protein